MAVNYFRASEAGLGVEYLSCLPGDLDLQSGDETSTAKAARAKTTRAKAGRPFAANREDRRQAILDAATSVFLEQGFSRANTTEIARRAGASKQTIYSRYPTKSALFAALMERRTENLLASYSDLLQSDAPVDQVLIRYGRKLVSTLLYPETQILYRLVVAEAVEFPEIAQKFWQMGPGQAIKHLHSYLTAQEGQTLVIHDVAYAAEQFHGTLIGAMNIRILLGTPMLIQTEEEIDVWVGSAVQAFLRAYGI